MSAVKICCKCGISSKYDNVTINKENLCNYCVEFEKVKAYREEIQKVLEINKKKQQALLYEKLENEKKKSLVLNRKYDVLALISGGKDSIAMLYELVNKYKLRVLLFTEDSGIENNASSSNIKNAMRELKIPKENWFLNKHTGGYTIFKPYLQNSKIFENVNPCIWCNFFRRELVVKAYEVAQKHKINLIVDGQSYKDLSKFSSYFIPQKKIVSNFLEQNEQLQNSKYRYRHETDEHILIKRYPNIKPLSYWREVYHPVDKYLEIIRNKLHWKPNTPASNITSCKIMELWLRKRYLEKRKSVASQPLSPAEFIDYQLVRLGHLKLKDLKDDSNLYIGTKSEHVIRMNEILKEFNMQYDLENCKFIPNK